MRGTNGRRVAAALAIAMVAGCGDEMLLCDQAAALPGLTIFLGSSEPGAYAAALVADGAAVTYAWTLDAERRWHAGAPVVVGLGGSRVLTVGLSSLYLAPTLQLAITDGGGQAGGPRHVSIEVTRDGAVVGREELTATYDDACHPGAAQVTMSLE